MGNSFVGSFYPCCGFSIVTPQLSVADIAGLIMVMGELLNFDIVDAVPPNSKVPVYRNVVVDLACLVKEAHINTGFCLSK